MRGKGTKYLKMDKKINLFQKNKKTMKQERE